MQLDEALRLDRMTEFFIVEYLNKLNRCPQSMFCNIEPDIIDCARLTYWYYLCLKNDNDNTFQHKKKEIKGELRRGLLANLEQFKSSYSYARIVFIEGTQSTVGFALNKWASDNNTDSFNIEKSLSEALELHETDNNFIPLIFAAGAYDYNYRLSSACLKIPVVKTEHGLVLDDGKLDLISVIK